MSFKSYLDVTLYKKNATNSYFLISGWAFESSGETLAFEVSLCGTLKDLTSVEIKEFDLTKVERQDVEKKYKVSSDCGFTIKVEVPTGFQGSTLSIIGKTTTGSHKILYLNRKGIEKITDESIIKYKIDSINVSKKEEGIEYSIEGWAYNEEDNGKKLEFFIKDKQGTLQEVKLQRTNRRDLFNQGLVESYSENYGFAINFTVDSNEDYDFIITDGRNAITETLKYEKILNSIKRKTLRGIIRNIVFNFSPTNVRKGIKCLIKYGPAEVIKRIRHPEVNEFGIPYSLWFENNKVTEGELEEQRIYIFEYAPKISLIVPTYNTPIKFLKEMIDSVTSQSYSNWELCIGDGSENNKELEETLIKYSEEEPRIKIKILDKNYGIAENTNEALSLATGEYVALFDHDDLLTPDALFEVVKALQEVRYDVLYTDEDKVNSDLTEYMDPNFKPDWSPDLFCSHNYITHLFVVKKAILDEIRGFRKEFDGSQDYDLMFRCIERANSIKHIPKILYHWRVHKNSVAGNPTSKMYAYEAGRKAIEEHYQRTGIKGKVENMELWGMYHSIYETPGNPLVSVIIPNKDHIDVLKVCIESLFKVNTYKSFEVIIVENNSTEQKTFDYYSSIGKKYPNIKIVIWEDEFNYSSINNFGVKHAKGDYLLFLNNDTEVKSKTAVSEMLGCCMREGVGVVGAKLLYPDNTVQHAGVVVGFGGFAGHVFTGIHKDDFGYMVRARINGNYSAVTAACMMVKRSIFEEVEGFTEAFKVGLNDIDFCLKVRETGKLVVFNAHSLWYHYESKSRGYENTPEKIKRFEGEIALFRERWAEILRDGDPYYNRNFVIELGPYKLG